MLTIRNDQFKTLSSAQRLQFVDRLARHLEAEFPRWYSGRQEREAREFIERVIGAGELHGVQGQMAVSTLAELMVEFGESFERSPDRVWALQMFAHRSLPGQLKVSLLSERLRQRTGGRRIVEIDAG